MTFYIKVKKILYIHVNYILGHFGTTSTVYMILYSKYKNEQEKLIDTVPAIINTLLRQK